MGTTDVATTEWSSSDWTSSSGASSTEYREGRKWKSGPYSTELRPGSWSSGYGAWRQGRGGRWAGDEASPKEKEEDEEVEEKHQEGHLWKENAWSSHRWSEASWSADDYGYDGEWIREPTAKHWYTLLWLHSCHGRPRHVEPFVEELCATGAGDLAKHLRVVAPCAPKRPAPDFGDGTSETFQWFEYSTDVMSQGGDQDNAQRAQLAEQRSRLLGILDHELRLVPSDGCLVLGGLSQGASMVLDLALHAPKPLDPKLRGIAVRRGMLQRETVEDMASPCELSGLPILALHGEDDDLVPLPSAQRSYRALETTGAKFQLQTFPGLKHNGYCEPESKALGDFVDKLLRSLA